MKRTAFIFPGQGSQYVGMGRDFQGSELFERANQVLGFDLRKLCLEGPEDELKKTAVTQPAIFTVSAVVLEALSKGGLKAEAAAGHSLGEYSALYAAGSISFEDGVRIVNLRGKFMQDAVPVGEGAMAAIIGLPAEKVREICAETGAEAANINSPRQTVLSGKRDSVLKAAEAAKAAGAKRAVELPVSAPFHSTLMKPAQEKLAEELSRIEIRDAGIPVVSNVSARFEAKAGAIRELLIKQVTSPVLWVDSVNTMIAEEINTFVEVGPKKVLSGLIKNIDKSVSVFNAEDSATVDSTLKEAAK